MNNDRQPPFFIAESLALDFLNSVATPVDKPVDWIDCGDGLLAWLEQARLVPAEALLTLKSQALPGEFDMVASQARALREWFRAFVTARSGRKLRASDLREIEPLNRLLARDERFDEIVHGTKGEGSVLVTRPLRRWRSPESLLLPIGMELAKFVCEDNLFYVKSCEGSSCTLLFMDRARGRARRWCSMAICGNRAKQIAHRNRRKANP